MPRTLLASAVSLLFIATGAQAQSLNALYEAARAYDASYLAARALSQTAGERLTQAQALRRPTVGVGVSATRQEVDPPTVVVNGVKVAGDRVGTSTTQAGLSANWSLYNRSYGVTISQAERAVQVAEADLAVAEQDLIVRTAQAYFDVLAARELLATAQAAKKANAEQLASAKRNFEVGTATITDTREAQARFDRALATEIAAENDLRVKGVTLDQLVGRNGVSPLPLAQPVALPVVEPLNVDPWVEKADAEHPQVRRARLGYEVAQLEMDKAKAADWPTLNASGTLGGQEQSGRGAQIKGWTSSASVGLQLNVPLYTGGYNSARQRETVLLAEKSRNDLEFARRSVAEATRRSFFGLQSLQAQVKALEAAESSAKLALEATQLGYKVGVRVNLDVLNAQAQLYSTQNDLAKTRYDTLVTSLRLRQASGQLASEHIAALDALLKK
jgi:outer membrane protein